MILTDEIKYLFIDGAYAREIYNKAMTAVFGVAGGFAPQQIVSQVEPFRTYIYECFDDERGSSETEEQFKARVAAQEVYRSQTSSLSGVHLREGTLVGKLTSRRQRRQKEVDILLAVDMLTHGFNRNMTHAVLLSGDLDFRPVVEALVRGGVFVEVWYEKTTAAKELYWAADLGRALDWHILHNWSDDSFKLAHSVPRVTTAHAPIIGVLVRSGMFEGRKAELWRPANEPFTLRVERSDCVLWLEHDRQQVLERYFSVMYGPIEWLTG